MDTEIRNGLMSKIMNIGDAFFGFTRSLRRENADLAQQKGRVRKEYTGMPVKVSDNPAATVHLGWRKDA